MKSGSYMILYLPAFNLYAFNFDYPLASLNKNDVLFLG